MLLLAQRFGEPDLSGWFLGLALGFAVILIVVIVVGAILALATRISAHAQVGGRALEAAESTTQPLDDLGRTETTLRSIVTGARQVRRALERS